MADVRWSCWSQSQWTSHYSREKRYIAYCCILLWHSNRLDNPSFWCCDSYFLIYFNKSNLSAKQAYLRYNRFLHRPLLLLLYRIMFSFSKFLTLSLLSLSLSVSAFGLPSPMKNILNKRTTNKQGSSSRTILKSDVSLPPQGGAQPSGGDATIPSTVFNLVKSIAGAGVLSLPAGTCDLTQRCCNYG